MKAVNLVPGEKRGDAALGGGRSGGGAYAVLGLIGGLTVLALLYGIASHQVSSRNSEIASLSARAQQVKENETKLTAYAGFVAMSSERTKAVSELAESRFGWAHALYELGRVLPHEVSIASLSGTVEGSGAGSSSTASSPAKSSTAAASAPSLILTGCANSQKTVAIMLNRLSLIHGVSEATLQSSSSSSATGGSGGGTSNGCAASAPSFTVNVVYESLPSGSGAAASSSPAESDASNSTLNKAQSAGGSG